MTLFDLEMTLRGQKQTGNPPHIEREGIELIKRGYLLVTKNAIRSFFNPLVRPSIQVPSQHLKCLHDKIGYTHSTVTGQCSKKSRQFNLFTTTFYKRPFKLIHTNIIFTITA